jgi:hypothetical protein
MLVYSMNQDSVVNLNNVNYVDKEDHKVVEVISPKNMNSPFYICFYFNSSWYLAWEYENESDRDTDFNLIKQKYGERLNEWD